jgi:hypothetical protein
MIRMLTHLRVFVLLPAMVFALSGQAPMHHGGATAPRPPSASIRITMDELHAHRGVPPGWMFQVPTGDAMAGRKVFVVLECFAGHEVRGEQFPSPAKGAFTGADRKYRGLFVEANGGTLFLDEVGDIPLGLQVKLLRVLQDKRVRPVGGQQDVQLDLRIISATHRDLPVLVSEGKFREDLYYRLAVLPVRLPTLASARTTSCCSRRISSRVRRRPRGSHSTV